MRRRSGALWLAAAALLMKLAIPGGFMPVISQGAIVMELCSGFGPEHAAMVMPATRGEHGKPDAGDRHDMPCGFGGHWAGAMLAAPPIAALAAVAIAAPAVHAVPPHCPVQPRRRWRPPLRGPPIAA